jgi:hypothetical protein
MKWVWIEARRASRPLSGIHGFAGIWVAVVGTVVAGFTGHGISVTVFPNRRSVQAPSGQREKRAAAVVVFNVTLISEVVIEEVAEVP